MDAKKSPALTLKERQEQLSESGRVACYTHYHYGWERHNLKPYFAVLAKHPFLTPENHTHEVDTDRKTVIIRTKGDLPVFGGVIRDGEHWFSVRYNIAPAYECIECGGTKVSHYSPFQPCWKCSKELERETCFVHANHLVGVNVRKDAH